MPCPPSSPGWRHEISQRPQPPQPPQPPERGPMSPTAAIHPFPSPPRAVRRGSTPSAGGNTRMLIPSEATQPHPALQGAADTSGSSPVSRPWRPAGAGVDLNAIRHNVGLLARLVAPAGLMAVVKADGYGHGSVAAAYAALEAGATWLGGALGGEGGGVREAGGEMPILPRSPPPGEAAPAVGDAGLTPAVHGLKFVDAL